MSMAPPLYIVEDNRRVEVFDDPVADVLILSRALRSWQKQAAQSAGLTPKRVASLEGCEPPYFVMREDVFTTSRFMIDFVDRAEALGQNARAGIASNPTFDRIVNAHPAAEPVAGGHVYDLRYVVGEGPETPVVLEMDDLAYSSVRFPKAIQDVNPVVFCESTRAILQISAPLHIYQANMHQNLERAAQLNDGRNDIGNNCNIHPTAYLEGCTVGDGATVGANAVLRWSDIGEGVSINDSVNMVRGIIGDGSVVSLQHRVVHAVTYPECFLISGAWQFSLMGHASAVFAAWITDARMDQQGVRTVVGGEVVDTGMRFLGALLGHRAKVTAGVVTAPGRIVPNGVTIHPDPKDVYSRFPAGHEPGAPYFLG